MSSVVGEAVVLVRPSTAGFEAEATPGITQAGTNLGKKLGKAVLAGFAIGGVYEGIKSVVEAATAQNTAFAVLDQTLKNAGLSVAGFSTSLHDKLEVQARATGVSAEDLAAAMNRLVPATGNAGKSLKDLNTAIGISESFHISLSTAALALAKAETGSFTSLQRYLGLIPKVTTNQDALKARYTALTEAGGKLDASQKAQYASALAVAVAQDRQLTSQQALATATQKFGGIAQTFADTYQGQFNRLHVAVDQLKVAVGTELVGGLAAGAGGLANYLDKLLESDRVQKEVHTDITELRSGFADFKSVLETVGPPVRNLVDDLGGVVRVAELLGGVLAARKIGTWIAGIGASEVTAATATAGLAGSVDALTAALVANTAALTGNAGALDAVAGGEAALGTASVVTAGKVGVLTGAVGVAKKALLEYLAVYATIKTLVPGQKDLGLDFSNGTAGLVTGINGSPYQKSSTADTLYQNAYELAKAGKNKQAQSLINKEIADPYSHNLQAAVAGLKAGGDALSANGEVIAGPIKKANQAAADKVKADTKTGATKSKLTDAAQSMLQTLRDGISSDKTDLAQIKQNLADAITQGAQAVIDAVNQAKQNLNSIGQSLATQVASIIDTPLTVAQTHLANRQDEITADFDRRTRALTAASNKLTTESDRLNLRQSRITLQNLGSSVLLPDSKTLSQDPSKALAQLNALEKKTKSPGLEQFIAEYQQAVIGVRQGSIGLQQQVLSAHKSVLDTGLQIKNDALKLAQDTAAGQNLIITRQIANLTDTFNKDPHTTKAVEAFQKRIAGVLSAHGITRARAERVLGVAGADLFTGDLAGLGQQAAAIGAGPQRVGTGLTPSITRPLQTLEQTTKQISQLRHEESAKQLDETRKTNKLLTDLAHNRAAAAFTSSLDKNPGRGSKRTAALSGTGG